MNHSIDMFSIQIDTKRFQLVFNNIKLYFFTSYIKDFKRSCTLIRYSRVVELHLTFRSIWIHKGKSRVRLIAKGQQQQQQNMPGALFSHILYVRTVRMEDEMWASFCKLAEMLKVLPLNLGLPILTFSDCISLIIICIL